MIHILFEVCFANTGIFGLMIYSSSKKIIRGFEGPAPTLENF